jgi:hypothetical protein
LHPNQKTLKGFAPSVAQLKHTAIGAATAMVDGYAKLAICVNIFLATPRRNELMAAGNVWLIRFCHFIGS